MLKRILFIPLFLLLFIPIVKAGCIESVGYPGYAGIDLWCSLPDNVCQQGDGIFGLLKTTGCPSTPSVQIEIKGDGCSITDTFSAGRYYCTGPGCWYEYLWYIPQLPTGCLGKTATVTVTSEGVSASKTIKLSTDPTRDNRPTMPKPGEWSVSPVYSTDKISYTVYAEDDKGLKEIRILASINGQTWTVVKTCSVSGTSASCTYTTGPYPAGTEVCFKATAIDIKGQEAPSWEVGARVACEIVYPPPNDTDGGKNYDVKGVCTDTLTWEDFCAWEGPRGYCCKILPGDYWHVMNSTPDGTVTCCRTSSPKFIGSCLETRIINCKSVLGEYYPTARECALEVYDCSKEGKTCFNGACVSGIPTNFSFSLSVTPSSGFVFQGDKVVAIVQVNLVAGTAQPVSLSCSNLPVGVSCSFSTSRCYPSCNSTLTISTNSTANIGNYTITIKGEGGGIVRTVEYQLGIIQKVYCAPNCQQLLDLLKSKFGSKCGDSSYDPVADVNKDGKVDMRDVVLIASKCTDDVYCQAVLQNKTNPCCLQEGQECKSSADCCKGLECVTWLGKNICMQPDKFSCQDNIEHKWWAINYNGSFSGNAVCTYCCIGSDDCGKLSACCKDSPCLSLPPEPCKPSCLNLLEKIKTAFGADCNNPKYDPIADVNKDRKVDIKDIGLVGKNCQDENWCQSKLLDKTNPCAAPPKAKLTCSECTVGKTCECSLSGCTSGLWVITSKEKVLTMPIVSDIPPTTITYNPVKGGTVKVLAVCFEPEVSVNRMEVNVKSGMLSCPDTCYTSSECTCSVQGCNSGIFIATGKPLDSPVVEDVAGSFSTSFTPTREGTIKAIAVCFEPTVKVERSSINVVRK
jgi:hypothetical protein